MWLSFFTGYGAGFDDDDPSTDIKGLPISQNYLPGVYGACSDLPTMWLCSFFTGYRAGFDDHDPYKVFEGLPIDPDYLPGVYGLIPDEQRLSEK